MDATAEELLYDGRAMITETDPAGRIVFVNRKFTEMSGYPKEELIGRPHSIIRHPDMPSSCFELMWETLREGNSWQGYVKNRRKDGRFYWVIVHIMPKAGAQEPVGYIAARKRPEPSTLEEVKRLYERAREFERAGYARSARKLIEQTACINVAGFPQERLRY